MRQRSSRSISLLFGLIILLFAENRGWAAFTFDTGSVNDPEPTFSNKGVEGFQADLFTGSATTSVPIAVPSGTAGVQPNLSLTYSSTLRNEDLSLIGAGWDLAGIAYVERNTKFGPPKYDSTDTYTLVLNGARYDLVLVNDNGTRWYRTQQESFLLVNYIPGVTPGANFQDYWSVTDKRGTQYFFGVNSNSKSVASGRNATWRWSLDRVIDKHDNTMTVTYLNENGMVYPANITYTGSNISQALFKKYKTVDFNYEPRPTALLSYRYGAPVTIAKRLAYIDIKMDGAMVRRYELNYTESTDSKKSLLVNVAEYGANASPTARGTGTSLPPVRFNYLSGTNSFSASGSEPWINQPADVGRTADFTGDGKIDIIGCTNGVFYALVSTGDRLVKQDNWLTHSCPAEGIAEGDFDGDGKMDIGIWDSASQVLTVYLSTGRSFVPAAGFNWSPPAGATVGYFGDFDGDGKTDILLYTPSNTTWKVQRSTGAAFSAPQLWLTTPSASYGTLQWAHALDLSGDGRTDLLIKFSGGSTSGLYAGISSGAAFSDSRSGWWLTPPPSAPIANWRFGDFNGDGLNDLLIFTLTDADPTIPSFDQAQATVYLSSGDGFQPGSDWSMGPGASYTSDWQLPIIYTTDLNGDGKTDLLSFHAFPSYRWEVLLSSGTDFTAPGSGIWGPAAGGDYGDIIEDFDGDGKIDRGEYFGAIGDVNVFLSSGPPIDLLQSVQNSLGGKTIQTYRSSSQADACATTPNFLPLKVQTVCSTTQDDGLGHLFTTTYAYKGGQYDLASREFRGFSNVTVTDPSGAFTTTAFLQTNELKGKPSEVESFGPDNTLFTRSVNAWDFTSPFPGVTFPFLTQEDTYIFGATSPAKQVRNQYKYDAYGNVIEAHHLGDLSTLSDDRHVFTEFFPNVGLSYFPWIISLPAHTYTLNSSGIKIAESFNYYDGATQYTAPPSIGALARVCRWLNSATSPPCTSFVYDRFGNRILAFDANNHTTFTVYDSDYHSFPVTETNALSQSANHTYWGVNTTLPLITGAYAVPGMLATVTDPNNSRVDSYWDALGRPLASVIPPDTVAAPTKKIAYSQTGVAPSSILIQMRKSPTGGTLDTYTFVDGLGRTIQTKSPGSDGVNQIVTDTTYNSRGLAETISVPYFKPTSSTYSTPDTTVKKTTTFYDPMRRISQITNTDGSYSSRLYDKWIMTLIDPNGHKKVETRDALGRLIQVDEYTGADGRNPTTYPAASFTLYATTNYDYDAFDISGNNIQTAVDALGNKTTTLFDTLGRKIAMHDPDMGDWKYSYDAVGNLLKQGDAKQQIISFSYDSLNRVISKTTSVDTTTPGAPTNFTATAFSNTQIDLTWTASADNVGVAGYWIERCQGAGCNNFARINTSLVITTRFSNTNLSSGTSYRYRAQAVDLAGNLGSYSSTATVSTKGDPILTLSKSGSGSGRVISSLGGINCGTTCSASLASGSSVTITATADAGSTFAGFSGAGCGAASSCTFTFSTTTTITASFADTQAPTSSDILTISSVIGNQITLSWTPSSDNIGVNGYWVEASFCPPPGCFSRVNSAPVSATNYTAFAQTFGLQSYFRVQAVDVAGNLSAYSPIVSATPGGSNLTISNPGGGTVISSPAGISCQVNCVSGFASGTAITLTATPLSGVTFDGFSGGCTSATTTCTFTITTNTTVTATFNDTQPPTAPSNLTATAASGSQINLSWSASSDNVGVAGYWIERCQGVGCSDFSRINESLVTAIQYNDAKLAGNTSYRYRVQAADAMGNSSSYSSVASASTMSSSANFVIAGGAYHSCVLLSGAIRCWGFNANGQLGNGVSLPGANSSTPVLVNGISNATAIAAGNSHTCALLSDRTVKCWGYNASGQLGNGVSLPGANSSTPVLVNGISNAIAITANGFHTCALLSDRTVKCWGYNASGQLGNGSTTPSSTPVLVLGISSATAVASGIDHSCALFPDLTMDCWGSNAWGQLGGTPSSIPVTSPVLVSNISNASGITAGGYHSCALLSDGTLKCWGFNGDGQIGNGTTGNSSSPALVTGISNAIAVAAGGFHSCALLSDGRVKCWGYNSNGQIGNGTSGSGTNAHQPAFVTGISNAIAVTSGGYHSCALLSDGTLKCWGLNSDGQIGRGTSGPGTDANTPVSVSGITTDTTQPTINNVISNNITATSAIISWRTNEGSTSQVDYGTTTAYGSSTPLNAAIINNHMMKLSGLSGSTVYHYRVRSRDLFGNLAISGDFTFITGDGVPPTAPSNVAATPVSTTQVNLSWTASTDNVSVHHYQVERKSNNGPYIVIASPTTTTYPDSGLDAGSAYVYRVRAFDAAGNASAYSNLNLATTVLFTDDPVLSFTSFVKAVHITELYNAVNAVLSAAGLPSFIWTIFDSEGNQILPPAPGNPIRAQHIIDLRNHLIPALIALGVPIPMYTDPSLTTGAQGTTVKAAHIQELRNTVK